MANSLSKRGKSMLKVAEQAIEAGMKVLAIGPRSKVPDTRFCRRGWKDATDDIANVKKWLSTDDRINLAASTFGSGICVVDVDGPKGGRAVREIAKLPRTRKSTTPNGTHRYYRYDGDLGGSITKFRPELDLLLNTYVLLPGSKHPEGGTYETADFGAPIARLPEPIADAIRAYRKKTDRPKESSKGRSGFRSGQRNNRLTSIAGALRRQGLEEGQISTALLAVNQSHCRPPLAVSEVERIAHSISSYAPEHEGLFDFMSNLTPRDVHFVWEPYLVQGAVNLLEGDPNVGKTYLLCEIAAALSSGRSLPGQDRGEPRNVLFMSAEDDPETTLVRRLMRMNADLRRISFMRKFLRLEEEVFEHIERHIAEHEVSVVIMDPLLAYMQSGIDMNKANETRPFMARLAELAKARNVTIIALRHLNKADKDKAIFRGLGSVDITAAARSAVMIGLHPEDDQTRVLVHIKHNLSERGATLLYELDGGDRSKGKVPKLVWRGESDLTAEDLAHKSNKVGRPNDASQEAQEFLRRALRTGERRIKDVVRDAERRSISDRTLRKAARTIGVVKKGQTWKLAETPL
ncbi:MAG: AAA family ATPase [Sphingomonas sp.]|nr:AAA family ATPase [Sphingomonas sp.]